MQIVYTNITMVEICAGVNSETVTPGHWSKEGKLLKHPEKMEVEAMVVFSFGSNPNETVQ